MARLLLGLQPRRYCVELSDKQHQLLSLPPDGQDRPVTNCLLLLLLLLLLTSLPLRLHCVYRRASLVMKSTKFLLLLHTQRSL